MFFYVQLFHWFFGKILNNIEFSKQKKGNKFFMLLYSHFAHFRSALPPIFSFTEPHVLLTQANLMNWCPGSGLWGVRHRSSETIWNERKKKITAIPQWPNDGAAQQINFDELVGAWWLPKVNFEGWERSNWSSRRRRILEPLIESVNMLSNVIHVKSTMCHPSYDAMRWVAW